VVLLLVLVLQVDHHYQESLRFLLVVQELYHYLVLLVWLHL
jgi:hypothetical protein